MTLLALASALVIPSSGGQLKRRTTTKCTNSGGGSCTVKALRNNRLKIATTRIARTLRITPTSSQASFDLVFDGFAKDCSAETTCPDGSVVKCSAVGPNTQCTSNATSVGCLTADDNGEGTSGSAATCPGV